MSIPRPALLFFTFFHSPILASLPSFNSISPVSVSEMSISSAPSFNLSTFSNGGANYTTTNKVIETRAFACLKYINSIESRLKLTSPVSVHTHVLTFTNCDFSVRCVRPDSTGNTISGSLEGEKGNFDDESRVVDIGSGDRQIDDFSGGGDNGGGGSFGGGDGGEGDSEDEREFGPILKFEDVMKEVEARGVELPPDMMEAAKRNGIRKLFLLRYLDLQESVWPLGFLIKYCSMLRNRMLADPSFLFKVGTEIVIDSGCATYAEMKKRGKDFWAEFELYFADLLVGIVVDIALVGMLAPYARFGQPSASRGLFGSFQRAASVLPSSVFEAERPGCKFSVKQRIATYFYKGVLYGSVGFGCGIVGQGIANLVMTAKRSIRKSDEDIPVPPLLKSAALWGVFLAVSSNTRYQIINGLERLVEASPMAKQVPPVAMAFTVGVRFANNIYGGMQFVDWAKWSGVQ